jgi:hypothetical protein
VYHDCLLVFSMCSQLETDSLMAAKQHVCGPHLLQALSLQQLQDKVTLHRQSVAVMHCPDKQAD